MSPTPMRLAIIGNCQAEALRSLVYKLDTRFEIIELPEYHLVSAEQVPAVIEAMDSADIVMAQRVAPDFPIEAFRPDNIRARYGARSTIWPNVYFDGYFPGLRYVYGSDSRKLIGPLGDYHFEQIIGCWLHGIEPDQAAAHLMATDGWDWNREDPNAASLAKLRGREGECDIIISDHIERHADSRKLMYSMNHPVNSVLLELLDRMMAHQGIETCYRVSGVHQLERLDQVDIPALPRYFATRAAQFSPRYSFTGEKPAPTTQCEPPKTYMPLALVEAFYRLYQDNRSLLVPPDWQ